MTLRQLLLAAATVLVAALGCDATPEVSTDFVRTDSAGIRIITSGAADRDLAWTFDSVDVLRDSLGAPWLFEGVTGRRVVTDRLGRVYVLVGDPAVLRFGRTGLFERSVGRKGGAPGEMEFPLSLMVQGDSLAVLDMGRGVLVRWGPTLEAINDLPRRGALTGADALAFRSGGVFVQDSSFGEEGIRKQLTADTINGGALAEVTQPRGTFLRGCGFVSIALPPFFTPDLIWAAAGPRVLVNVGPAYDVRLYEGPRLIASVRRTLTPRAPTVDDVRRLFPEGLKLSAPNAPECTFSHDALMTVGLADVMPFVTDLALLSDGTIWVQRSLRDEVPSVVDVFGSDGGYAGTLRGMALPVGRLPNGELLVPVNDEESGGQFLTRFRVTH